MGPLKLYISCFSLMERWVHTRAFASVLGPRGRASLDAPPQGAKSSFDDDVPTPRLRCGVEPVRGGTVSDASHPPLRCEPTMTIPRTFTSYVSGYGESAVSTLSASEQSSVDESERTLHFLRCGTERSCHGPHCTMLEGARADALFPWHGCARRRRSARARLAMLPCMSC